MRILGNIIWIIFGGFFSWLGWVLAECLLCITIIVIPFGMQFFKIAKVALCPFGTLVDRENTSDHRRIPLLTMSLTRSYKLYLHMWA